MSSGRHHPEIDDIVTEDDVDAGGVPATLAIRLCQKAACTLDHHVVAWRLRRQGREESA